MDVRPDAKNLNRGASPVNQIYVHYYWLNRLLSVFPVIFNQRQYTWKEIGCMIKTNNDSNGSYMHI